VLGLAVADTLYRRFPERPEGDLARIRAHAVSRQSCAEVARRLGLDDDLAAEAARCEREADIETLIRSQAVMAALVESAIGAVYLEYGLKPVAAAVVEAFSGPIDFAVERHVDHKTVLQEALARLGASVTYRLMETSGPPHRRTFTTAAMVDGREAGRGAGTSKKASEQAAAREALAALDAH
jgi:ribonuclease-3